MPHDPVTLRQTVVEKSSPGGHESVVLTKYEAPTDADGNAVDDPFARMDLANAKWMLGILQRHYPGHLWRCVHDGAQKMAYVSIPILMGINRYWAINLVNDALSEGLLMRCGGEILERYGIPRSRFSLTPFLEAREKHSALVVPGRLVPG
jgi:hypothetical protein